MKIVITIAKIALFVWFLYNSGLFTASSVSRQDTDKQWIHKIEKESDHSGHDVLFAHASDLQKDVRWNEIGAFLWNSYYSNIPLGFLYFLIIFFQKRKKIKNPISIVLISILYPITIGKLLYNWVKITDSDIYWIERYRLRDVKIEKEIELFLTIISKDEWEAFKNILLRLNEVEKFFLDCISLVTDIYFSALQEYVFDIDHVPLVVGFKCIAH